MSLFAFYLIIFNLLQNIFAVLWGMQDLSSLVRDQTYVPCSESVSLNLWTTRKFP